MRPWSSDNRHAMGHASFPHNMDQGMHVTGTAVPTMTCSVLQYGSVNSATKGCITGI